MKMLLSLSLLVLLAIYNGRTEASCYRSINSLDDLPDHFFRQTKGKRLDYALDAVEHVQTQGTYRYFGLDYDELNVDVNGVVSFGTKVAARHPYMNNQYDIDMVSVFWAGTDIRYCGNVLWRETDKQKPRNRFRKIVSDVFDMDFYPNYIFIVTYFNVDQWWSPCCSALNAGRRSVESEERDTRDAREPSTDAKSGERPALPERPADEAAASPKAAPGLNNYQIVLATDGSKTFAILNYAKPIRWTDSPYSMAGFWTEYGDKTYGYKMSFTAAIADLAKERTTAASASLPQGQYIFRVDEFPTFINDPDTAPKFQHWP